MHYICCSFNSDFTAAQIKGTAHSSEVCEIKKMRHPFTIHPSHVTYCHNINYPNVAKMKPDITTAGFDGSRPKYIFMKL